MPEGGKTFALPAVTGRPVWSCRLSAPDLQSLLSTAHPRLALHRPVRSVLPVRDRVSRRNYARGRHPAGPRHPSVHQSCLRYGARAALRTTAGPAWSPRPASSPSRPWHRGQVPDPPGAGRRDLVAPGCSPSCCPRSTRPRMPARRRTRPARIPPQPAPKARLLTSCFDSAIWPFVHEASTSDEPERSIRENRHDWRRPSRSRSTLDPELVAKEAHEARSVVRFYRRNDGGEPLEL